MVTIDTSELKLHLRQIVWSTQNVLVSPKDSNELVSCLEKMHQYLTDPVCGNVSGFHGSDFEEARKIFRKCHYSRFLECLLDCLSVEWIEKIPKGRIFYLFDDFFMLGNLEDAFIVLCSTVTNTRPSYKLNKCVSLLEEFIRRHKISEMLYEFCQPGTLPTRLSAQSDTLVLLITTLPDRIANKMQRETSDIFLPKTYVPLMAQEIVMTLDKVHRSMQNSQDMSLGVLSTLMGKMCIMGHGDLLCSPMLDRLLPLLSQDFLWCRISDKLVTSIPDGCIESVITVLLQKIPWYGTMDKLLGNSVMTNQKLQYVLTNKLIMLRCFKEKTVLQNIIGYLATSTTRKPLFLQMIRMLLDVWSDGSAIKHTAYEQHLYISKAVLVCVAFLQSKDKEKLRDEMLENLMPGVQCHLDSSVMAVRRLGMLVAEAITAAVHPTGEKLSFEYEEDEETESLKKLLIIPEEVEIWKEEQNSDLEISISNTEKEKSVKAEKSQIEYHLNDMEDLDSDDDLEPYDMSHDVKVTKTKKPVYIRSCMEGLISSDDPDRVESCLMAAEALIRSPPVGLKEIAAEFAKILLHLQDSFAISQFSLLKHRSLVALAVYCPIQVADCLTKEFFDRNYNLKQRMDMLEVLAAAAQELSQAVPITSSHEKQPKIQVIQQDSNKEESRHWRDIVQERIEKKSRRFGKGRTKPEPTPTANRFAPVAGNFFFPLIRNFDQKLNTFDLLGDDHILLVRLLYTLGIITYAAINAPIIRQMSKALMEFIWVLRYHPQKGVCRALLFAVCMVLLSTPGHILLTDLQTEIYEIRVWMEDLATKSPDEESQKLAMQALSLLQQLVQMAYKTPTD